MHGYQRSSNVGDYKPFHINAALATATPVGKNVATTATTAISAGATVAVTPASMANIEVGMALNINGGTGTAEDVVVTAVTSTTFTATFLNAHSGTYNLVSHRPTFLGEFIIGQVGTSMTLTLYDGHPSYAQSKVISVIVPVSTRGDYPFACRLDNGLFITVTGTTPGDYTIQYIDGIV